MPEKTEMKFWKALNEAMAEEMERDSAVVLFGEDVAEPGGAYGVTRGLLDAFGPERVRDTPISEAVVAGMGVGAAAQGLRPIAEIMYLDFTLIAMDQIVNQAAKYRYFSAGADLPLVIRAMCGLGAANGAQHSQSLEGWYCSVPGLKVVMPSSPADAKGLLKSAIRDDDPVIFIETMGLIGARGPVPTGEYLIPLGEAEVKLSGGDVTVVATGRTVGRALESAQRLAGRGISVEVVDPRTLWPLDWDLILGSVRKTGRLVVAHEAIKEFGFGAEICARVAEECHERLAAPPTRVGAPFTTVPTPGYLAEARSPGVAEIERRIIETVEYRR